MTVIAFDGKTLAVDRQGIANNMRIEVDKLFHFTINEETTKRLRLPVGSEMVWAVCGTMVDVPLILSWLEYGGEPPLNNGDVSYGLVVDKNTGICYEFGGKLVFNPFPGKQLISAGAGGEMALGAMGAGASAIEAIKICETYSPYSGMGVDSFTLPEKIKDGIEEGGGGKLRKGEIYFFQKVFATNKYFDYKAGEYYSCEIKEHEDRIIAKVELTGECFFFDKNGFNEDGRFKLMK